MTPRGPAIRQGKKDRRPATGREGMAAAAERKSLSQQLAAVEAKAARLRAAMAKAARKLDTRQKIIIGATVIEAMKSDHDLRARVVGLLQENVVRPLDREAIAPWLSST